MGKNKIYDSWKKNVSDPELVAELALLENNEAEIAERFSGYLQFGTAGIRGILGVGSANINVYTILKTSAGVAKYLNLNFKSASVVIAYDNRKHSQHFAHVCAEVLSHAGISVYLFDKLTPTPILSYVVRKKGATLGINITSSHNGKEYNGFKVVNSAGAQIDTLQAVAISREIEKVNEFNVKRQDLASAINAKKVKLLTDSEINDYLTHSKKYLFTNVQNSDLRVIYTPLNGTGAVALAKGFDLIGAKNVAFVTAQAKPDENFTTVPSPNPELFESFKEALKFEKYHKGHLIVATDPDCDRLGVLVKHGKRWVQLTGDQVGVILLRAIIEHKKKNSQLPKNSFIVTSVVSSPLASRVAYLHGVKTHEVLIGFKNIGNKVEQILAKKQQSENSFVFAYEEACGYLSSPMIRDKDGILPTLLLVQLASELKKDNKTLVHYLQNIYKEVGVVLNDNYSFEFSGLLRIKKIKDSVEALRQNPPQSFGKTSVVGVVDYLDTKKTKLESQNFLEFTLLGGRLTVRPSGTEPKLKVYTSVWARSERLAKKQLKHLRKHVTETLFKGE